ncbi:MAG TPA: ATP-dependent DNA helicase [Patescibacteria group bacterium]|nr:ATP-dependent DNA helicase [Patescibacteria group bacterium]
MSDILQNLNSEQKEAVTHTDGPLMIIAGAGTGKTTVMTRRIAWLIEKELAKPDEILALTFTEKAAAEMEERVDQLLPYGYVDLWISTFHAFCQRILQQHGLDVGLSNDAQLMTEVDAWLLVRQNIDKFNLDYYKPLGNPTKFLRALLNHFSRAKDEDIDPKAYLEFVKAQIDIDDEERDRLLEIAGAYETYEQLMHDNNVLDFGALIMYTLKLFRKRPAILKQYREQFKYIIVDEFQDTNYAQYELVKLLADPKNNLAVVGDDDQAIYSFRGASVANILRFEDDYPKTARVILTKNYRSQQGILDASYSFIQQNDPRRLETRLKETHGLDKELKSQILGDAHLEHIHADNLESEVKAVIDKMTGLKTSHDCEWSDMAVLVRANDNAEPFLRGFDVHGIPYRFMALSGLYRKPIVLDAIALLRIIDRPYDSASIYRLLSHEHIGIPERDLVSLTHEAKKQGKPIVDVISSSIAGLSADGSRILREISDVLQELRVMARRRNALEVMAKALKLSGLYGAVLQLTEEEQAEQMDHLQQFYERIRRFVQISEHASLHDFIAEFEQELRAGEDGGLQTGDQSSPDEVQVMTLHGAKGLEYRFVFIVNLVDRRFPAQRRSQPIPLPDGLKRNVQEDGDPHLEEERRLMYVGMTRAKERLYLTSGSDYGGKREKKLSRFLTELGHEKPEKPHSTNTHFLEEEISDRVLTSGSQLPIPTSFSFTQLTAYGHCPLQYKFAHLLKIPVFGNHAMSFGKTMHNTLQTFFEKIVAERKGDATLCVSKDELMQLYDDNWIDEWYEDDKLRDTYREDGRASLSRYYDELQVEMPQPLFLERGFTLKIGDITIRGRIDRIDEVDGGVEIIDYKTGSPKDVNKLSATDKMQLLLYQLAAREIFNLEPKKLTFHYLKDNSRISFIGSDEELDSLRDTIMETIDGIRGRRFEPTPGFMCRFCDFRDICPFRAAS